MCPGSESETNEEILRLTSVITDLEAQMVDLYGKYRKEKRKNRRKGKKKNKLRNTLCNNKYRVGILYDMAISCLY